MTRIARNMTALTLMGLALGACSYSNETTGRVGGAIAGGILGSQFGSGTGQIVATAAGALAGGIIGENIGRRLDRQSRTAALQAEYDALETGRSGQAVEWRGNDGNYGRVVPQQTYQVGSQNCRRYTHTVYIDGTPERVTGTACRNPDGSWTPLT